MSSDRFDEGLEIRKEVLGEEYVEESLESSDEFTEPLQQLVTEFCWGSVWSRPGLSKKQRSLINLGILTALNRPHELGLHLEGALNNDCTKEEIREVLLQTAVYCGLPASIDSFQVAREFFEEKEKEQGADES